MADIAEASRTSSLELQKQLGEYKEKNRRELAEMQTQLKEKCLEVEKARLSASKMQDEVTPTCREILSFISSESVVSPPACFARLLLRGLGQGNA